MNKKFTHKVALTDATFTFNIHTEVLTNFHDVNEYIHWLRCQFSTDIHVVVTWFHNQTYKSKVYLTLSPLDYKHVPPRPLFLNIKKKRRNEKKEKGYYYES